MLDVSCKESDLFVKDVDAKEKYEGQHKTANINNMIEAWGCKIFSVRR